VLQWVRVTVESPRVVPGELWEAAHARLAASRAAYRRGSPGEWKGRPPSGVTSKYLLTGMLQCGSCHASLVVVSHDWKRRRRCGYACYNYHSRGPAVCPNALETPMEETDREIPGGASSGRLSAGAARGSGPAHDQGPPARAGRD